MAHPQKPDAGNEIPGYYVLEGDTSNEWTNWDFPNLEQIPENSHQTAGDEFPILEQTREASTQTAGDEFPILEQTREASTQTAGDEFPSLEQTLKTSCQTSGVKFNSPEGLRDKRVQSPEDILRVIQQPPFTSKTSGESRKRKILKVENIEHASDVSKQSRNEIFGMSDLFAAYLNEKGCRYLHFKNIDSTPSPATAESSSLVSVTPEFSYSEESYSQKELNALDYLGMSEKINTEYNIVSNKNIFQMEKSPPEKLNANVFTLRKEYSVDENLAAPGSSTCSEGNYHLKVNLEKLQDVSPLKQPKLVTDQEQSRCVFCRQTIYQHEDIHSGKRIYRCCQCPYIGNNFNYLQKHIYKEHTKHYYCNVCRLKFSEISSHSPIRACDECGQHFECIYQLEKHYALDHEAFLKTNCLVCRISFFAHRTLEAKDYLCCVTECKKRYKYRSHLIIHLKTHYV